MSWALRQFTKPSGFGFTDAALRGSGCTCGGSYNDAALEGAGESYTDAALRGAGESYTDAALRGAGESYTDAALRGGSIGSEIEDMFKAKQLQKLKLMAKKYGGKKIRSKKMRGGFGFLTAVTMLPAAIKGAKFVVNGIKKLIGKAKGGKAITPKQRKIYLKLIRMGSK